MARRKKKGIRTLSLLVAIFLLFFFLILESIEQSGKLKESSNFRQPSRISLKTPKPSYPDKIKKDRIAILIDDLGPSLRDFNQLENIHPNLSFAVLPFQTYSIKIARKIQSSGHHDLILHLPMEAENKSENPGKGAIFHSMNPQEIERQTRVDLQSIPEIQGVNNHMGSKITSDESEMKIILKEIKSKELFFVDSRTTSSSIAHSLAADMGIKSAERQVFLDDTDQLNDISKQFDRLVDLAHQKGFAIAIGHPRPNTVLALRRFLPRVDEENLELVPVSTLVR
ncbi:MAG: divergent polysaccharide deacetylase family protein [Nitrospiria bacterium]